MVNTAIPACLVPFHCLHLRKSNGKKIQGMTFVLFDQIHKIKLENVEPKVWNCFSQFLLKKGTYWRDQASHLRQTVEMTQDQFFRHLTRVPFSSRKGWFSYLLITRVKSLFLFHFFLVLVVWYIMGGMLQRGYILCRKWKNWWKRVKRKFSLQRAEYEALAQVSTITDDKKQPYNRLPA